MIERVQGDEDLVFFVCDDCGEESQEGEFRELLAEIKEAGWRITKEGDEWVHYCPDCKDVF